MSFSLNKLGDVLMNIGKSTLQTGTFYAASKAINSPCNHSVFGFGGGFGCGSFPMTGMCGGIFGGGYNIGMGMYPGMGMMSPYSQMAIGQAYGQGFALGEQLKLSAQNGNFNMFNMFNQIPQQQLTQQTQTNPAAEKFTGHSSAAGEQLEKNMQEGKGTRFVSAEWSSKSEADKNAEYKTSTINLAKSYITHMDKSGNQDNEITREEFANYNIKTDLPENATETEKTNAKLTSDVAFQKIDLNGDGKIDWKEMSAVLAAYDSASNGTADGIITREEMENTVDKLTDYTNTSLKQTIQTQYNRLFGNNQ